MKTLEPKDGIAHREGTKWMGINLNFNFDQTVLILKSISKYFIDIGKFIFQPREYFKIVSQEKPISTLWRLILYAIGFDLLVFCLFNAVKDQPSLVEPFKFAIKIFGIAILEILWGLFIVPPLFLAGQFCKPKIGLRISTIYSLTVKFVYLLIPITFYVFFILTENYVYAVLKGVFYYVLLIFLLLFFPFLFSTGMKRRLLSIFVSLFSFCVMIFGVAYAFTYFSIPINLEKMRPLTIVYDPVASEVKKTLWDIYISSHYYFDDFDRFSKIVSESISKGKEKRKGYVSIPLNGIIKGVGQFEIEWNKKGKSYKEELEKQLQEVERSLKSVRYSTTKEFLNLKEIEIRGNLALISKLDELGRQFKLDPSKGLDLYFDIVKSEIQTFPKTRAFVTRMNDYWKFILPFREYYIIVY